MNRILYPSVILVLFAIGCSQVNIGNIGQVAQETFSAAKPLTDEEEYYVGRAVAARILSTYPLLENRRLTEYVNSVGETVALHSDRPVTYGGYHFAILNSGEITAFSCPGGIVFITKGMINAVRNEDELAAVLAHEVAHVNHRDGVSAIQKARLTQVATLIGAQAAQRYTPGQLSQLVGAFEGSIDDVFKTLVVNGYGRSQEFHADESALSYLSRTGYNPSALKDFLERLVSRGQSSSGGIMKTHPGTADRIERVKREMPPVNMEATAFQIRVKRFQDALR
jgi:beta-barrel assembly-enhancing protease